MTLSTHKYVDPTVPPPPPPSSSHIPFFSSSAVLQSDTIHSLQTSSASNAQSVSAQVPPAPLVSKATQPSTLVPPTKEVPVYLARPDPPLHPTPSHSNTGQLHQPHLLPIPHPILLQQLSSSTPSVPSSILIEPFEPLMANYFCLERDNVNVTMTVDTTFHLIDSDDQSWPHPEDNREGSSIFTPFFIMMFSQSIQHVMFGGKVCDFILFSVHLYVFIVFTLPVMLGVACTLCAYTGFVLLSGMALCCVVCTHWRYSVFCFVGIAYTG